MKNYLFVFLLICFGAISCNSQPQPVTNSLSDTAYQQFTDSAKSYVQLRDTSMALQYHKRALVHARREGLHEQEARTLMHIAILLKGQKSGESLSYLNNALRIAEGLDKKDLKADILMAISAVYKQQQNYRESLGALEAHQKLLNDVFEKNKKQEAGRLRAKEVQLRERDLFLTIVVALGIITVVFAFYYRKTRQLNTALYQSNQIKDTLFSIIGHDLRGPAGNMMQVLEMMDTGLLDQEEEKEMLGKLKQQSRTFNETLNTMLSWATAQLKGAQPKVTSINTMSAIQKSLDLLKAQAAAKEIEISSPAANNLNVLADSDQFDFIVRNLISNAIKFSYPGGKIDITTVKQADAAVIKIRDHGQGIPADKQSELFAEGRLSSTYGTKGEKGTGLGLMLSWDFVRANRGKIWCDSEEGEGTAFYISLPLAV